MSDKLPAYDAGYQSARKAIAVCGGTWKLRPQQDDFHSYVSAWEEYLEGWMQAVREDREKQLSWDFFYPDGGLNEEYWP